MKKTSTQNTPLCSDIKLWVQITKTITPLNGKKCSKAVGQSLEKKYLIKKTTIESISYSEIGFSKSEKKIPMVLDLHGLTHTQAYECLKNFITQAHSNKIVKISVITGKGRSKQAAFMTQNAEKSDLLQIQVPRWLEHFSQVKSWQVVPRQKGGEGVLCIVLNSK